MQRESTEPASLALLALAFALSPAVAGDAAPRVPLPEAIRRQAAAIRWTAALTDRLIREMPKVETHVHLDGALSPALIQELAAAQGLPPFAGKSVGEIRTLAVVDTPRRSLQEVLDAFATFLPLLRRPEALERVAYELVKAARTQNIRHLEVRFAPALQATPEFPSESVLAAALRGLERGRRELGVSSGVIVCLIRPFELVSREENEEILELAVRYARRGVVAIDLAGNEAAAPLSEFREFYLRAKAAGLRTTAHAGEVPGSRDIETALELGVDRLGHATMLARNPGLMERVRERGVTLEINLTSNLRTAAVPSYAEHPVRAFYKAGIPVTLSTDDPGVFGIDLDHEYGVLAGPLRFTPEEILTVSFQGIDALFLPEDRKREIRREFESSLGALLGRLRKAAEPSVESRNPQRIARERPPA